MNDDNLNQTYKLKLNITSIFCALVLLLQSCNQIRDTHIIKLGHALDVNHSVHKAMVKMGEELENHSQGRMKIEIYPNQQLGTERQLLELLQIGSLDMTKVSAGTLENFAPNARVLGLPYLFRDRSHAFSILDGPIGKRLLEDSEKYWLKGLGFYDAGSRSFYSKTMSINHPDDLKGQKIRVMESVSAMEMVKGFGGSPAPISWGELYTSLQQGVVDGAENNPPSFYLSGHYEVCKYYSLNEHTFSPDVLIASTSLWNSLTSQEQEWLSKAVKTSINYQRELWAVAEAKALEAVKKAGVLVSTPDKTPFQEMAKKVYEIYRKDEALYALIEAIQAKD